MQRICRFAAASQDIPVPRMRQVACDSGLRAIEFEEKDVPAKNLSYSIPADCPKQEEDICAAYTDNVNRWTL